MKIAVVGSGCAGLGATWALNEYSDHEVHLYEADDRPGGHANTLPFTNPQTKEKVMVDTGFIVCNPPTYPNFLRFLRILNVPVMDTEMTFALTRDNGAFEWAGDTIFTLFCQPRNLFKWSMWRMVWDILRFNASARKLIVEAEGESGRHETFLSPVSSRVMEKSGPYKQEKAGNGVHEKLDSHRSREMSIGEYLEKNGYSDAFKDDYLIPMTAAIWSTPPSECAEGYTARSLLRFMHNHHLLQLIGKPKWLTIIGGSINYVTRVTSRLPAGALRLSSPIVSLSSKYVNGRCKVTLTTAHGHTEEYDRVILACHSNTALKILSNGQSCTQEEKSILGGFGWTKNTIVLHSDVAALPHNKSAWSAWNYVTSSEPAGDGQPYRPNSDQFALSYLMNTLQRTIDMERFGPVICTLNPTLPIKEELVQARIQYEHPTFNVQAEKSQNLMHTIQNTRGISYAGAWMGYGFHEDGFTSGLRAAVAIGDVKLPFKIRGPDRRLEALYMADLFDQLEYIRRMLSGMLFALLAWIGLCST